MEIVDIGYIISTKRFGENSGLISVFCRENGIYKGIVKNITSKKNAATYIVANKIQMRHKARLHQHLGNITAENLQNNAYFLMQNQFVLKLSNSLLSLINITLAERNPELRIYNKFEEIMLEIRKLGDSLTKLDLLASYVEFELILLEELGFALDLEKCAGSAKAASECNLSYVSPRTGRAVSKEYGEPYKDKLFILPQFILSENHPKGEEDILNALNISGYFLARHFFASKNLEEPRARKELIDYIDYSLKK